MIEVTITLKKKFDLYFKAIFRMERRSHIPFVIYFTALMQIFTIFLLYNSKITVLPIKKLDMDLKSRINQITEQFNFDSLTDYDNIKNLNKLIKRTLNILEKNELNYWDISGTLLGAIRDKGLVTKL